ncbi:hypothetical protein [Streptomyces sp. NPDC051173]|uniref:hypothetical protein n=1 Tax=Streptomyces sp. NPDC051173 TaxID=3155164 RepID=UPI00344F58A3
MTTRDVPDPDSPDTPAPHCPGSRTGPDPLRQRYIAALQAAAFPCDGDCGLDERACYDAHPVTWAGTVGQETHVEGAASAIVDVLLAVQDGEMAAGRHVYLSTGCLHGDHGYCKSNTGSNGAKIPAVCKFCGTFCTCECHQEGDHA